jgi:hypothetical protein
MVCRVNEFDSRSSAQGWSVWRTTLPTTGSRLGDIAITICVRIGLHLDLGNRVDSNEQDGGLKIVLCVHGG